MTWFSSFLVVPVFDILLVPSRRHAVSINVFMRAGLGLDDAIQDLLKRLHTRKCFSPRPRLASSLPCVSRRQQLQYCSTIFKSLIDSLWRFKGCDDLDAFFSRLMRILPMHFVWPCSSDCRSSLTASAAEFSLAVNGSLALGRKCFIRSRADRYADLRIENMPKASMCRSVGMNRRIESGSVRAWASIFSGLACGGRGTNMR